MALAVLPRKPVTITITGTNDTPVIDGGVVDGAVTELNDGHSRVRTSFCCTRLSGNIDFSPMWI